ASMKAQGIQTSWHYPPAHTFSIYGSGAASEEGRLAITDLAAKREITLPLYPTMREEQVEWVVDAIRDAL
ncbi:MAG TPA: DegT/DnrJ/EryC1/StrS family aminotransferase, partial [Anaerolineaceae bacterium]|nr:DegT/DnrJ/EryC1/StrS family aminotransferase [Anaerolineaceae bacterium]